MVWEYTFVEYVLHVKVQYYCIKKERALQFPTNFSHVKAQNIRGCRFEHNFLHVKVQ
jgi:hypothetical protein